MERLIILVASLNFQSSLPAVLVGVLLRYAAHQIPSNSEPLGKDFWIAISIKVNHDAMSGVGFKKEAVANLLWPSVCYWAG
jgi:hypothetical protein